MAKNDQGKSRENAKKLSRRQDGTLDSRLGHPDGLPGAGADLASTDMEIPEPSAH